MWFPFWRSRDRFSLEELRYLTDQLQKVQIVNDINKDLVIEILRSIAELVTYGDQHDPTFFEFFMEKQVMGEFVRVLRLSRTVNVPLQLLQTMSIMIQNFRSERAIYYIFSNEHINYLITYTFDFRNEELLSYYISFLRAISGKLNRSTISLLVKTENDVVVSFPLYIEAIRYAFHEENMVRIAVRALTLNVYHVGDACVNRYVTSPPLSDYFSNLITYFRKQCITLDGLVSEAAKNRGSESASSILSAVDEIKDYLYYFSDVISSGVPNLGRLITDNILRLLVFTLLLPSLRVGPTDEAEIGPTTSLYLLCCILCIVKTKDLANSIAVALFCSSEDFTKISETKPNGNMSDHNSAQDNSHLDNAALTDKADNGHLRISVPALSSSSEIHPAEDSSFHHEAEGPHLALREVLLSYIVHGDDIQVLGSLSVLATLLQTKELDEVMLDALGILPQRKRHKKLLLVSIHTSAFEQLYRWISVAISSDMLHYLTNHTAYVVCLKQALVGEGPDDEQLFSPEDISLKNGVTGVINSYAQKLKDQYGFSRACMEVGVCPRVHRFEVLDALVNLFCRSNISAETLWLGGWLLRQLLPYIEKEFNNHHLELLKGSFKSCSTSILHEVRGTWPDLLITTLTDEWKKCKKVIEASSPQKEPKHMLLPLQKGSLDGESSFSAGERLCEIVKVFVLHHQLQIFSTGGALPDQPPFYPPSESPVNPRAITAGLDGKGPKPGTEIKLVDAVPCRIAFERGKERHFFFLAISRGTSGCLILAEELPLKQQHGVVRIAAPLAGSNPRIDEKHSKWLHLRIRPLGLPFVDPSKFEALGKGKAKALLDGRWTLAFRDEESCKTAVSMILEELDLIINEVERRLKPLLELGRSVGDP